MKILLSSGKERGGRERRREEGEKREGCECDCETNDKKKKTLTFLRWVRANCGLNWIESARFGRFSSFLFS